jgi:hypothetical protein
MSSGFQPGKPGEGAPRPGEPASDRQPPDSELLEKVLQVTQSLGIGDDPLDSDDLRALSAVARRRKGEPLSVEMVTELVQTVLRPRFRKLADSQDHWERMTSQIAETLYEDPQTLLRIRSLWTLLGEAAR